MTCHATRPDRCGSTSAVSSDLRKTDMNDRWMKVQARRNAERYQRWKERWKERYGRYPEKPDNWTHYHPPGIEHKQPKT